MSKTFWSLQGIAAVSGLPGPSKMLLCAGRMLLLLHTGYLGLNKR